MFKRLVLFSAITLGLSGGAWAFDDGEGREWRSLSDTEGLSWLQAARLCPVNGQHTCNGTVGGIELAGWVWATRRQVMDLFNLKLPKAARLDLGQPARFGLEQLGAVEAFLADVLEPNHAFCINYACGAGVLCLTASRAGLGGAYVGAASWHRTPVSIEAGFSVGSVVGANLVLADHGLWMFRGDRFTAPVPEPATSALLAGGLAALAWRRRKASAATARSSAH
jgi:PEP-CTERM motif